MTKKRDENTAAAKASREVVKSIPSTAINISKGGVVKDHKALSAALDRKFPEYMNIRAKASKNDERKRVIATVCPKCCRRTLCPNVELTFAYSLRILPLL